MRSLPIFLMALAPMVWADRATQTWMASPGSAEWSTTAPNWDAGVAWGQSNLAVFAESSITNIVVPGTTHVYRLTFNQGNWSFTGNGRIVADMYGPGTDKDKDANLALDVAAGASVDFSVPIMNKYGYNFNLYGSGTVTLNANAYLFRTGVNGGTLRIVNARLTTAKMQRFRSPSTGTAKLYFDGASLAPCNGNIMLGETDNEFDDVTVGAGGLTFTTHPSHTAVSFLNLKHHMRPADDLGDAIDGGVTMAGTYNFYIASPTCDLRGGFKFLSGKSYLRYAAGVGTGPIYLDAPLYATNAVVLTNPDGVAMMLPNEIIFNTNGVLGIVGGTGHIEFTNVTFAADNESRRVVLTSKTGGGTARYAAAAGNVPFGGFSLSGGIALKADGDTWTAHASAASPFVSASVSDTRPVVVGTGGLVFDTNGQDLSLGAILEFPVVTITNWLDETMFENGSFESGSSGWTFGGGKAGDTDVRSNGGPFDGGLSDYQTPYGSKYVQVRSKGGYIQRKFRVPETGEWHILFEYANRYNNDPDGLLTWGVYIDGEPLREKANDGLGNHGFITYNSPAVMLEAGVDHTFRFETGENIDQTYGYDSMLVDGVRFARSDVVVNTGSFTKQGQGTLVVPFLDKPGTVNVQAGRLEADGLFESNTVNVASGATFAFRSPWEVYVPNASFEDDATDLTGVDRGFSYSCRISGWTLVGGSSYRVVPGWLENGSMASQSGPYTTNGTHAAYLRPSCSISAPVYVSRAGSYELSFEHVSRWGGENDSVSKGRMLTITATIDGNTVVVVPPRDYVAQPPFVRVSGTVALSAGCHELKIETDDANGTLPLENTSITSGTMVFIDNVRLVGEPVGFPDLGATWNFASGATVDVGDADIVLDKVYVNGVRIRGGAGAFRAAGLNVLGTGSFRSGPPSGFRVLFK